MFGQSLRQMESWPAGAFCKKGKLFETVFLGEYAHDAGGPYREMFATWVRELESPSLPLAVQTPNGLAAIGANRESWLLTPARTDTHREMLRLLGRICGFSLRNAEFFSLTREAKASPNFPREFPREFRQQFESGPRALDDRKSVVESHGTRARVSLGNSPSSKSAT